MVIIEFELSVNADNAIQDVRDKLDTVKPAFRDEVKQPLISRVGPDDKSTISLALSSDRHSLRTLTTEADQVLVKRFQTVRGVGKAELIGGVKRAVEIRIDPARLQAAGVGVNQVMTLLQRENQKLPAGSLVTARTETLVQVQGKIRDPQEFGQIVVATHGGSQVRLSDVATIVDGQSEQTSLAMVNGKPALSIDIFKIKDANTVEVADGVKAMIGTLQKEMPPGMSLTVVHDGSIGIRNSLDDVSKTLLEGALLTVLVVFLFLGSWRSTVITGVTLPISLLGTVFLLLVFGFSLNVMTLMALSLCIGLLIDDSIVVRENIMRHQSMGKNSHQAALEGTQEIGLAVLATTLTIVAVFLPVGFMKGIIGKFFFQFGLTVAGAVLISMFVSFTLDPMLSSVWHDPHIHGDRHKGPIGRLLDWFESIMDVWADRYALVIRWSLGHRKSVLAIAIAALVGSFFVASTLGSEFVPESDLSELSLSAKTPVGSSLEYTAAKVRQVEAALRESPYVVRTYATINSGFVLGKNEFSVLVKLVPRKDRPLGQKQLVPQFRARLDRIAGITVRSIGPAASPGNQGKPIFVSIQGSNGEALKQLTHELVGKMEKIPGMADIETSISEAKPTLELQINRARAADLGVSVATIGDTLRPLIAGDTSTTWEAPDGENYDVIVRLPESARRLREDLTGLSIASNKTDTTTGQPYMVPLTQLVTLHETQAPTQINRRALMREVKITANVQGRPAGDVGADLDRTLTQFQQKLPPGYRTETAGANQDMKESFGYAVQALLLAVIFIYMILASQFNSFLHPMAIMTSLPLSLIGVFLGLRVAGSTLNIFSIIGVIMLMGLVTKNAILLVDFVEQAVHRGGDRDEAIVEAGRVRLRPILMTTFAMVFGMMPLALGLGEGAEGRAPMAHAVIGGVITSTLLTLIVVPVAYTYLDGLGEWLKRKVGIRTARNEGSA